MSLASMVTLTPEQAAAIDAFTTGQNVSLTACAGAGKTFTLVQMGLAQPKRHGLYAAFDKRSALDAEKRFTQSDTHASTLHALAFRAVMRPSPQRIARLVGNAQPQRGVARAKLLGINPATRITLGEQKFLNASQLARLTMETVDRFCHSADAEISRKHVASQDGIDLPAERKILADHVLPIAQRAWADIKNPSGVLNISHDHYLKAFALQHPQLDYEYLLLDEAQDSNPVTIGLVADQQAAGTQIITVGDECQAIYSFRGAVNGMNEFDGIRMTLQQSFRFGPAIAEQANLWLEALEAELRVIGTPGKESSVGAVERPDALLARTNAEAMNRVMRYQAAGLKVALQGGAAQMQMLAEGALLLKAGRTAWQPQLAVFESWAAVIDYAENDHGGSDFTVAVKLIDEHGPETILGAIARLVGNTRGDSRTPDVVVTTAHKSKGGEWGSVAIADDFREPKPDENGNVVLSKEEARLSYVAVTRAKTALDRGPLGWIETWLRENRGWVTPTATTLATFPVAGEVCGAEHVAYGNVTCHLAPHSDDVLHDAAVPGLSQWGRSLTRQPLSA